MFLLLAAPIAKKVEYFAALSCPKVKLFKGPDIKYPLLYVLMQRHYPIKVIGEFDNWCRVVDVGGETGWIKKCHLSTKYRRSIVVKDCFLYSSNKEGGYIKAKLHKDVFLRIKKTADDWSYIVVSPNLKGWVRSENIW